ncbi:MAG TPA: hypothetical protein VF159_10420 [Gemmatimonadaceae bacterium]
MLITRTALTLVALALLPGCTRQSYMQGSAAYAAPGKEPITIEVSNDLRSEAKVFLARSVVHRQLGTVLAGRTSRFTVPAGLISGFDVHLTIATMDGTTSYASEEFVAWPGEVLTFKLTGSGAFRGR